MDDLNRQSCQYEYKYCDDWHIKQQKDLTMVLRVYSRTPDVQVRRRRSLLSGRW